MTSPSSRDASDGSSGMTKEMNFWPKSVVGRISTETLLGMSSASSGSSATVITAFSPFCSMARTWPTSAPWRRTSPNLASCRPARSAWIVIVVLRSKVFW